MYQLAFVPPEKALTGFQTTFQSPYNIPSGDSHRIGIGLGM